MALLWLIERVAESVSHWIAGKASRKIGESLVRRLTQMPRGWNRQLFDLPDRLATSWGIQPQTKPSASAGIPPARQLQ
jgi:hypothetical protein